jgi:hypothetical protein
MPNSHEFPSHFGSRTHKVAFREMSAAISSIRSGMANTTPDRLGPQRARKRKHPCGIRGLEKQMSRARVLAQCAGNRILAKRHRFLANVHEVNPGHRDIGRIRMYWLCEDLLRSESSGRPM